MRPASPSGVMIIAVAGAIFLPSVGARDDEPDDAA